MDPKDPDGPKATQADVDNRVLRKIKIDHILKCASLLDSATKRPIGPVLVPARSTIDDALFECRIPALRPKRAFHTDLMKRVLAGIA